ncbi:unnamed protein product [Leuciscus chuanchicus]
MSVERGKDSLSKMSLSEKQRERSGLPESSSVSMRSDRSKDGVLPSFSKKTTSTKRERSGLPESSSVSMRSDRSKDGVLPSFSEKTTSTKREISGSPESSSVSMRSDRSKDAGLPSFSKKTTSTKRIKYEKKTDFQSYRFKKFRENLNRVFQDLEQKMIVFLKNELEKFKKILKKENTQYFVQDYIDDMCSIKEAALDITLHFLKSMKQDELADTLKDELVFIHQQQLKSNLKKKYRCVFEGIAKQGDSIDLNDIYTDLYITQGGSDQVNTEHEVRQIEISRRSESQEIQIECTNLFESPEQGKQIKTVLTKGVAGIGKSISVQKFILDWAEGKKNQDISFIFSLPFREMNLKEKEKQSLMNLVSQFFPEIKRLNLTRDDKFKVLFILDGLDECRLPLNFKDNETWCDVSSSASLDVLLTNLIKGNLLPSALIWITTRPAAATKIPPVCIDRVTEVRGFNDPQKQEYFRKRFNDEEMANRIIFHVKQSKSLFIMCHIPVFCWISATVLQNILEEKINNNPKNQAEDASITLQESNTEDLPKTLTQMYTHFLRFQIHQSRQKYDGEYRPDVSWDKDAILSLGKLAFHQLEKNNLIFYDTDLKDCGIDADKASVFSGMCTQIFKEETGIIIGTMYCFVHLSIQEFIAALYAHLFLDSSKKSVFVQESTEQENKNEAMVDLLKTAVDKALASDNGHLDLFLRFLLGLSLQSNYPLLRGLLTQQDRNDQSNKDIVQYIKQKLGENVSPERSINLFYCLNELNDQTLVKDIQTQLREGSLSSDLSPAQWSALVFVLLTSEEELEDFELEKFKKSDECLIRLSAVIKTSKRALLNDCNLTYKSCSALAAVLGSDSSLKELNMNNNNLQDSGVKLLCTGREIVKCKLETLWLSNCDLTEESCSALASVLSSDSSILKDLDLSNNNLQDSGVKLLSEGLKNNCKLEKLRLANCGITEEGYKALASALRSNPSHLIELDLRGNDPGQSGVKELSDLLQDPDCQLKMLWFLSSAADEACQYVKGIVGENPLLLKELNLSECELGDTNVKKLTSLLEDKHCKVNRLKLNNNSITAEGCAALTSAFNSNLIELDLSENKLGNSGIKKICPLLENTQCRLTKLKLSDCSITEEGYKALASALRSNPSHLIELDLRGNDPGQSGVKELDDLLQDEKCKLKTRFLKSAAAQEACECLTKVLGKSPLLLTELDLSEDKLGDLDGEKLSALLMDSHSKVEKIKLNNCELTEKSCSVLATVLSSKTILKELNLNNSRLLDSGVKEICEGLKNPVCELKILKLSDCSITEEGYKALASALRSNPSHLIELDLRGNDPGQSGVKELSDLLQDEKCKLKTRFLKSAAAQEACECLTKVLGKSPLLLTELDLSEDKLGDLDGEKLSALLMDSHSKVEKIKLNNCELTEKSCSVLATVLSSKTILKELNLNNSRLLDSGVKEICEGLKNPVCELKILKLSDCSVSEEGYKALASALRSSHLIELDLRGNDPGQSGVKELSDLLQDLNCQLKTLSLRKCGLTEESCSALATVLRSNSSLKELDISNNNLQDSGVKKLQNGLGNTNCTLEKLRLSDCSITEEGYKALASALRSNPSHLIELDLRGNDPGQSGVKELYDLLQDQKCQLKTLRFLNSAAEEACQFVNGVLGENLLLLRELNLSECELGPSGLKKLAAVLQDKHCKLNTMILNNSKITDEDCRVLTEALNSNPSNLTELNLSGTELRDSGMKIFSALFKNEQCQLKKLKFNCISITAEGCSVLASAFNLNPSNLKELELSENKLGNSGVTEISTLLGNSQCTLQILRLSDCSISEEGYKALASALRSNPSHLIELDLTGNDPGQSGVKELDDLLQDQNCQLKTLSLRKCGLTEESCSALTTVLRSNSSLKELDISNNNLQDSGVKKLKNGLGNTNCTLERLRIPYKKKTDFQSYRFKKFRENLNCFQDLEQKIIVFLKNELEKFKKIQKKENTQYFVQYYIDDMCSIKEAALDITLYFLKIMKQDELAETLKDELVLSIHQRTLKSNLKKKYRCVFEGIAKQGDSTLLNDIYTDLYITQGGSKQVNTEHEVRQIEISSRAESQEIQIECTNLFESPEQGKQIKTVLTKGAAGIGKSISVQKFILDWAEGKENQDISFILPLPFRKMNLKEKEKQSLMNLVSQFFPEIKGLNLTRDDKFKVLFILDGLDECRLPLNFKDNETWRDVSSPASLDVLLTNLIKGNLLPSALIWITTRPAAATKIPPDCIDRVTEVRGFNDAQKEEYFRKRFTDEKMANRIIDHVKQSKSLFIMCHIPVFCWISATVLQNILEEKINNTKHQTEDASITLQESNTEDIPKTLTQMYTHFLRFQIQQSRQKYDGEYRPDVSWDKDAILSLGKLAFHQLEKNNLIFYDTDLMDCGIDASKASVYSGMCTQIFKEETGIIFGTMYCFVHMSIQEFIAALYAHLFLDISKKSVFAQESTEQENKNEAMIDLLKTAVDKALASDNGHLDLFLRFLLGLSVQSNYPLLRGLLTQQDRNDHINKDIVQYIKQKLAENLSPERSINLFYCLNELNDQTLVKDIQTQLREGSLSSDLSPAQWSAVAFVLMTSEEELEDFELEKFKKSDECLMRLSAVIKTSKRALIPYKKKTDFQSYRFKKFRENLDRVFQDLEQKIIVFLKNELEKFKKILKKENTQYFVQYYIDDMCSIKEAALDITLYFLKSMKQDELAETLKDELVFIHQRQLKSDLKKKYRCVFEGIAKQGDSTLLNNIYTDLYITQGGSKQVNTEHEVRQIEISRRAESQEIQIECTNLFESPEQGMKIKTVLTKGVAGIGKSISVQKFILDWAEGKENQDISFILPLPFREMNLKEKEKQSLMNLVSQFFPDIKGLNLTRDDKYKVLFILDGLDECRLPLNFKDNETWCDVSSPASLDVLLTNLIKGNLLPSALIWITTRPAAATKIPPYCIDRVTEVRGFNDTQKEEYFRKRFTDEKMANRIIDHVKQSKSLFIMCHIPVFCWISATVLQNILEEKINNTKNQTEDASITLQESNTEDIPKTLTQMYTHFLRFQIQQSRQKYDGEYRPDVSWDKDAILSLGKLAFHQLEKNNLIFYDTDLKDCGIDASKASVYSGMCTQIFKEETGIIIGTMYCFVHMSIQEFIAALYAHLFLDINKKSVFVQESTEQENKNEAMIDLLKTAVDKALASDSGHLDLFLQFLLGLSLQSNYPLLRGLLTQQDRNDQSNKDIVQYIKQKLGENLSPERSINLFYCLNELNDQTLVKDIQTQLREGSLSSDLSPAQWSAVAFVLLTSEEELEDFELEKFKKSDECLIRLSAVIKTSKRALLNDCNLTYKSCPALAAVLRSDSSLKELHMNNNNLQDTGVMLLCTGWESLKCKLETLWLSKCDLTEESCSALASVLSSDSSILKDLDLSNNNLQDSGVKLLSDGLKNNCKLEKLRLSDCSITEEGYKALASALRSNPSHLIELDLRGNDPGQSGVKELSDLLQDQKHQLKKLRFLSPAADKACEYVRGIVGKNPLLLRELNLSGRKLGYTRVNQIAALLQDKHCKLNTLMLNNNSITAEGCAALTSAFNSNPSNLIELDLSDNKLGNSGIKKICPLLENTQCRLMKLKLSDCSISEEGYKALASALRSNPSHLIELDLRGNDPGQSGVKELDDLLQDQKCSLKTLR